MIYRHEIPCTNSTTLFIHIHRSHSCMRCLAHTVQDILISHSRERAGSREMHKRYLCYLSQATNSTTGIKTSECTLPRLFPLNYFGYTASCTYIHNFDNRVQHEEQQTRKILPEGTVWSMRLSNSSLTLLYRNEYSDRARSDRDDINGG
jgi:hypothetical protein